MDVIEALRTSIMEPRDHFHINHDRMSGLSERTPVYMRCQLLDGWK